MFSDVMASVSGPIFLNEQTMQTAPPTPLAALVQAVAFAADKQRNQRRRDDKTLTNARSSK